MPQPKSRTAAVKATAGPAEKAPGAGKKAPATTKRRASKQKPGDATPPVLDAASPEAQAARDEAMLANLTHLRELLAGGVMLTAQRVQESMDDAVRRGKMTRRDAEELARALMDSGRRQSLDVIAEIEQLLGRGRIDLGSATSAVRDGAERLRREVDRVRRGAGVGPSFPIFGYDELTAGQITERLDGLTSSELRMVRDHEKRTANRKSVLAAVDKAMT